MHDPQTGETADGLFGEHGGAVVGHQGTWQAAFHEGLRQAMHETLGGLVEIPLQVADQPRAIVDDAKEQRLDPPAGAGEDLAGGMMEVEMPEGADVVDFVAPDFQPVEPIAGQQCAGGRPFGRRLAKHPLRLEVTTDRRIRRRRRAAPGQGDSQIVEVQLHRPARMLVILRCQDLDGCGGEALEATEVAAQAIAETGHRIGGLPGRVVVRFNNKHEDSAILT
jgi:hypothetical protein